MTNGITAKVAAQNAAEYFNELMGVNMKPLIEEVEMSADKKSWLITLSHLNPSPAAVLGIYGSDNRLYKRFDVDSTTGEVRSMTIRNIG